MPQGVFGSRLQAQWALGHASWNVAWGPTSYKGIWVMDRTIGPGSKAQKAWGTPYRTASLAYTLFFSFFLYFISLI